LAVKKDYWAKRNEIANIGFPHKEKFIDILFLYKLEERFSCTIVNGEILKIDKDGYFKLDNFQLEEEYFIVKKGYYPISTIKLAFPKTYKLSGTLLTSNKKPHDLVFVGVLQKQTKTINLKVSKQGQMGHLR